MCAWQVEALREKEEEHAKALAALRKEHETESIRRSRTSGSFEPPQPPVVTPLSSTQPEAEYVDLNYIVSVPV